MLENHPCLLYGRDFANKRLALPIWSLELLINENKYNYLKYRDLAPLMLR